METLESFKQQRLSQLIEKRNNKRKKRVKKRICALITTAAVCAVSFGTVYTVSAKEITITQINEFTGENSSVTVTTRKSEVMDILDEQGISVSQTDKLNMPHDAALSEDSEIVLRRGKEILIVTSQGNHTAVVTSADTQTALREAGYNTSATDEINMNGESIASSDTVEIKAVTVTYEIESVPIDFETVYENDNDMYIGEEKVTYSGNPGELAKTYKVSRYEDGTEKERVLEREEVITEPVKRIVRQGTKEKPKPTAQASAGAGIESGGNMIDGHRYSRMIEMEGTAYTDSPAENGGYTVTALGTPLKRGVVAVDPRVIPLRTKVYVVSSDGSYVYGVASAEDTGGAIKGNKIDLCIPSEAECNRFGRRSVKVYILED